MSENLDTEQWQNFNERLSQWISDQGFWFQLRYSLTRGGSKGSFTFHLLSLSARFLVFLIAAAGLWLFVVKMTGRERYAERLSEEISEKFAAEEIEYKGIAQENMKLNISRLAMIADDKSFFNGLEIANLSCQRGFLVDFGQPWDPGLIEISKANVSLRAGSDSDASSQAIADVLFQDMGDMKLDAIHVAHMSLRWGYNARSRGSIYGSKMRARRLPEGWRLTFRGGTFSQNWLRKLEIVELDVIIRKDEIRFEKANFKKDGGWMNLENFKIEPGQRPKLSGVMKIKGMDISSMVPLVTRGHVEGRISGEFSVMGSTNTTDGIGFNGMVNLQDGDMITLRDRVPLLRALSVVDAFNTYRRVDFQKGSFRFETQSDGLVFSDVKLYADDLMEMEGDLRVRKPKSDEELVVEKSDDFYRTILRDDESAKSLDLSLREAAEVSSEDEIGFKAEVEDSLFGKLAITNENRRLKEIEAERLSHSLRYEGGFQISLMKTAFVKAPKLREMYPVSEETGRIPIWVPIEGVLYELTSGLANKIYSEGGR